MTDANNKDSCEFPKCAAGTIALDQTRQHNEVTGKLNEITDNQRTINGSISRIGELLINLNHLTNDFAEHKRDADKRFDTLFCTLREMEQNKADKGDLNEIKRKGADWMFEIIKAGGILVAGVLLGKLI